MQATASPVLRDIVLIGGGHSHVGVLHMFAMKPMPGVRLTVICTDTDTPYSGMLPGYIAGHYSFDEVHIDLRRLAEFAGARYYRDEVVGIDRATRQVLCRKRPPVPYDAALDQHRLDAATGPGGRGEPSTPCRSSRSAASTNAGWPCWNAFASIRARRQLRWSAPVPAGLN
jgi:hypothetical protein